ncbi:MAG: Holliday junction resolvase [Thermoplasmata archaeon]|jgi:Holliday junction resolvase
MSGSQYERELKRLLEGDPDQVNRYIRINGLSGSGASALRYQIKNPFFVVRSAGSRSLDLLAVRSRLILPIEIKSTSSETVNFTDSNGRNQRQFQQLRTLVERSGLVLFYALRLKSGDGEPWRFFVSREDRFWSWVPAVVLTKNGNVVLKWSDGIPLSEFLRGVRSIE